MVAKTSASFMAGVYHPGNGPKPAGRAGAGRPARARRLGAHAAAHPGVDSFTVVPATSPSGRQARSVT